MRWHFFGRDVPFDVVRSASTLVTMEYAAVLGSWQQTCSNSLRPGCTEITSPAVAAVTYHSEADMLYVLREQYRFS